MSVDNDPFNINPIRGRTIKHAAIPLTMRQGDNATFFRTGSGQIFADRSIDLSRSHRVNDRDRAAWCGLAGVKLTDLRARVKAERKRNETEWHEREVTMAKSLLERDGYRVTKTRKPKGAR